MLDDHKYSSKRTVAYAHIDPEQPTELYGPGGPSRTYGTVVEVHMVDGDDPRWEYTVKNSFTGEERRIREENIFHGANAEYLDMRRRDGIHWSPGVPGTAMNDASDGFWKSSLSQFVRTAIPAIRDQEQAGEQHRTEGRELFLSEGDYLKIRGDLRDELEPYHNLYAKVVSVRNPDLSQFEVTEGTHGLSPGMHRVLHSYRVLLDCGDEVDIYDIEIKAVYTSHGRADVLNWRAATFLAEEFGDEPPYEANMEYLSDHIFSRRELADMDTHQIGELLARLLYVKGMITRDELDSKAHGLSHALPEYLVDHILSVSRFDMRRNRSLEKDEIERMHGDLRRLRDLLG